MRTQTPLFGLGALLVASCGGGGGGAPPPAANRPPAFTSAQSVSVPETTTTPFYTVTASDPDGDPVSLSLSGGADRDRFAFNGATGELRFSSPLDFEAPSDADRNNIYEAQFTASDGRLSATLTLQVQVTDTASSFRVRRVAQGLASPIFVAGLPDGSGRIVVVERAGRIRIVDPATGAISPTDFLNIIPQVRVNGEEGLLSIAFSPDFVADRSFYVHMNNLSGDTEVRRYRTLSSNPAQGDPASGDVILQVDQPAAFTNHKGGWLGFDLSGRLLISLGDGGGGGDPLGSAQDRTSLLGKILRIDPRSDAFPSDPLRDYAIPSANPFAAGGGAPEVLAMGLRNPFRASIDRATGDLYIGDVGQGAVEEIDRLAATTTGLVNYGWNQREGSQPFAGGADSPAFTLPVAEYFHGVGPREGRSVTGGVVHRGPVEALQGEYVFADFISRNIWSVPVARLTAGGVVPSSQFTLRTADFAPDQGAIDAIAAFGEDVAGNLYIVDLTGEVFRLEAGN